MDASISGIKKKIPMYSAKFIEISKANILIFFFNFLFSLNKYTCYLLILINVFTLQSTIGNRLNGCSIINSVINTEEVENRFNFLFLIHNTVIFNSKLQFILGIILGITRYSDGWRRVRARNLYQGFRKSCVTLLLPTIVYSSLVGPSPCVRRDECI